MNYRLYLTVSFLLLLASCDSTTFDSKEELIEFITDSENGYLNKKQVQGYDFSLLYKPTDVLVHQELGDTLDLKKVKALREKYKNQLCFTLSMSKNNQEVLNALARDKGEFGAMVNQLAFKMDRKVHLFTEKKDTIPMMDFIYPRMYGMSRSTDILFVFPKEKALESETLNFTIEDLGFYTGEIKFKIPTEKIKNQPQINFE